MISATPHPLDSGFRRNDDWGAGNEPQLEEVNWPAIFVPMTRRLATSVYSRTYRE